MIVGARFVDRWYPDDVKRAFRMQVLVCSVENIGYPRART